MSNPVGLIGVGAMGRALLGRLRAAGRAVQAYDVAEPAQRAARDGGATLVASPAAAARGVALVHVIVVTDEQVIDAMTGRDGVLAGAAPGTLVLLHSTILPMTTERVAAAAAAQKVDVVDAPISAVPRRLEAGHGVFLLGGPQAPVDAARGHLLQLGEAVHHFGPLGAGNVAKLAKNLLSAGERIMLAEVLDLVAAGGLDLRQFLELERTTRAKPQAAEWERNFVIEDGHARHRPATNLFNKDVMLAAKLSQAYGLDAPLMQGAARTAARWVQDWAKRAKPGR
jgi:3-hydroxyisobutyrate dehydrogenase-like beta-hydroxyacid dehydrogenase